MRILSTIVLAAILFFSEHLRADAPLEPPGDFTVCSLGGSHCAFLRYNTKPISVWSVSKRAPHKKLARLLEMPGWFRNVSLSEDGRDLVVAYATVEKIVFAFNPSTGQVIQGKLFG